MSVEVYFGFSTRLSKDLKCPKGTYKNILGRVKWIEDKHDCWVI